MGRDFAVVCYRRAYTCYYGIAWFNQKAYATERRRSVKKSGSGVTGNGWTTSLLYFATKELSLPTNSVIWEVPIS